MLARYVVLVIVLALVATAAFAGVEPADRPLVLRLAVAAFATVVVIHLYGHFSQRFDETSTSAFDEARRELPVVAKAAAAVTQWQDRVQHGIDSQRFFNAVLWPRLEKLSGDRDIPQRFQALRERRWLRRGPSLPAIAELVRHIEEKK